MRWRRRPRPRITDVSAAAFEALAKTFIELARCPSDEVNQRAKEYILAGLELYGLPHPDAFPDYVTDEEIEELEEVEEEPIYLCKAGEERRALPRRTGNDD